MKLQKSNLYLFLYYISLHRFKKEVLNNNYNEQNKIKNADNNLLADYFDLFFSIYSKKIIEKFKEKNSNQFSKEILDSLSINDLFKNEVGKNEQNNKKEILEKCEDDIIMEDAQKNDESENENIFEEIKDFISFDKNNKNKDNTDNNKNNNNYNVYKINDFNTPKICENDYRNYYRNMKYDNIQNNIKTIKGCSPDRANDSFDYYSSLLIKNPYDNFEQQQQNNVNHIRNNFIRNNIYKNQQFQGNQLFNFNKQYEVNSFLLEPQYQPPLPPYYLQKTIPLPYNNQIQIFPYNHNSHNSGYSPSFYSNIHDKNNQFNYFPLSNNYCPLLKTIQNNNNNFLNTFNFSSSFVNSQIKHEDIFNYNNNNYNSNPVTPTTSQEKKTKKKIKKKLFIKNNKLVYVINEKHTDTKDVIYLDEDSESNKDDKIKKINKLDIIKEKLAEERKPRSSKFRGVSKNGKQWQVLIMIKQKKRYIGNFSDEEEAAREYDKIAIQFHGPKAKTNFQYNEDEIKSILAAPKCKKLSYLF